MLCWRVGGFGFEGVSAKGAGALQPTRNEAVTPIKAINMRLEMIFMERIEAVS